VVLRKEGEVGTAENTDWLDLVSELGARRRSWEQYRGGGYPLEHLGHGLILSFKTKGRLRAQGHILRAYLVDILVQLHGKQ
jgi:hypothetical protein